MPYHTTFEITEAQELKDTKLSAACSLHAATSSSSSSTSSLRRRRLMEITEEEEEEERERKRQSVVHEEERPGTSGSNDTVSPLPSPEPPVVLGKEQIEATKEVNFASTAEKPNFEGVPPTSPNKFDVHGDEEHRLSSQTVRPDLYSSSSYTYGKPRVKLGPRPSLEANKRPHTASSFRPVAALPAGFKLASKGSKKGRSGSRDSMAECPEQEVDEEVEDLAPLNASVTISESPQKAEAASLPPRPNTSSGASVKSISSMTPIKEPKVTPEKARLMKAMKMRQQKKKLSLMIEQPMSILSTPGADHEASIEEEPEEPEEPAVESDVITREQDDKVKFANVDSAVAVELHTPVPSDTEVAEDTFTDSHPASPTIASSEVGQSTKASSLSGSTDETVQATKDDELDEEAVVAVEKIASTGELSDSTLSAEVEDKTLDGTEKDTSVTKEPELIPLRAEETAESTQENTIGPSTEQNEVVNDTLEIRPQEVVLPLETDDEVASPKSPYGIPVSKFSSNDSKSPTTPSLKSKFSTQDLKHAVEPIPAVPAVPTVATTPIPAVVPSQADSNVGQRPDAPSPQPVDVSAERRSPVLLIRTDMATETLESELSDPLEDDDLMDELQSATFEEAQPMSVSKSPITPVFPSTSPKRPRTVGGLNPPARSFSNPMRGPLLSPSDVSSSFARSVSAGGAALLHNITQQPANASLSTKKPTSSSIAQRIKALEQLSGKASKEDARPRTATPSSSFIGVRKQSVRESSRSPVPSFVDRANSINRHNPTPDRSRDASPDFSAGLKTRERSGSVVSRLSKFETGAPPPSRGRPESIQVTARIVRDGNNSYPKRPASKDPAEYETVDLKQSPLVVDHLKALPALKRAHTFDPIKLPIVEPPQGTIQERRQSRDDKRSPVSEDEAGKKRRSSLSIVKDFIKDRRTPVSSKSTDNLAVLSPAPSSKSPSRPPSINQVSGSSLSRRLSISSRSSFSKERDTSTPIMSPTAPTDHSSDDADRASLGDKKNKSRTSRFMRRLSNTLVATSRKNSTPNTPSTVREEDEATSDVPSMLDSQNPSQPALTAYMGDVNVQFPDNLLWKRRSLCLDTQGFLVLNAINGMEKIGTKRYHLSEFRPPYIPDVDLQELPNSICLDFVEGSALQVACEDRPGQKHTLRGKQTHISSQIKLMYQ